MADLFDGRHLEMWFPSNLPFDQFPFELALSLVGAGTGHTLITNGAVARVGAHAWNVTFPAWFSSVSPMIELHPTDELAHASAQVTLRRSGRRVSIDAWKRQGGAEELRQEVTRLQTMLASNEATFGPFPLERYTCFFHGAEGGMEYAGATTTSPGALEHEALHSWFARGVMPASDADGWWDEGFTAYLTQGGAPAPLDFDRPPVALCSRRPFQRHTDGEAYGQGTRVFGGIAALVGQASLVRAMGRLFRLRSRTCLSTAELEEHLVLETGAVEIVDVFHRFVYGFADPSTASGVRIAGVWLGAAADGRPWLSARLSNDAGAAVCRHFVVVFAVGSGRGRRAGLAAVAGFDLHPGSTRVVRAPVPAGLLDADDGGADVDVVASVHVRRARPTGAASDDRGRTVVHGTIRRAADRREPAPAFPSAD